MSLWTCLECTARYAVGLLQCPQCASTRYVDESDGSLPEPASVPLLAKLPSAPLADGDGGD